MLPKALFYGRPQLTTIFGKAADRVNMLHPAVISVDGTSSVLPEIPLGVSITLPANYVYEWTRGGSNTSPTWAR